MQIHLWLVFSIAYCGTYTMTSLLSVVSHIKLSDYWLLQRCDPCHHLYKPCPLFSPFCQMLSSCAQSICIFLRAKTVIDS